MVQDLKIKKDSQSGHRRNVYAYLKLLLMYSSFFFSKHNYISRAKSGNKKQWKNKIEIKMADDHIAEDSVTISCNVTR